VPLLLEIMLDFTNLLKTHAIAILINSFPLKFSIQNRRVLGENLKILDLIKKSKVSSSVNVFKLKSTVLTFHKY